MWYLVHIHRQHIAATSATLLTGVIKNGSTINQVLLFRSQRFGRPCRFPYLRSCSHGDGSARLPEVTRETLAVTNFLNIHHEASAIDRRTDNDTGISCCPERSKSHHSRDEGSISPNEGCFQYDGKDRQYFAVNKVCLICSTAINV